MSLSVMDTDSLTLLLHGHPKISRRSAELDPAELAITIITVEETLTGWYTQIRRAKKDEQLIRSYAALQQAVECCGAHSHPFDEPVRHRNFPQTAFFQTKDGDE